MNYPFKPFDPGLDLTPLIYRTERESKQWDLSGILSLVFWWCYMAFCVFAVCWCVDKLKALGLF